MASAECNNLHRKSTRRLYALARASRNGNRSGKHYLLEARRSAR